MAVRLTLLLFVCSLWQTLLVARRRFLEFLSILRTCACGRAIPSLIPCKLIALTCVVLEIVRTGERTTWGSLFLDVCMTYCSSCFVSSGIVAVSVIGRGATHKADTN